MNWTVTVPAWDSQQGYNANGTPALTVEQQVVALASCLQAGSREDAASHCRELVKRLDIAIIPRTTVAAALRELRAEMFNYAPVAAIDAAIAALGLADEVQEEIR